MKHVDEKAHRKEVEQLYVKMSELVIGERLTVIMSAAVTVLERCIVARALDKAEALAMSKKTGLALCEAMLGDYETVKDLIERAEKAEHKHD